MKFDLGSHRPDEIRIAEHGELVSLLTVVVEHLREDDADRCDDRRSRRAAAQRALAAAIGAERQLADLRQRIASLEKLAVTDELTGLLNRRGFETELDRALALARRHGVTGMLIYIDLDSFKMINDSYGHGAGDEVLCQVAALLRNSVRTTDVVGRLGGDEFAVLMTHASHSGGLKRARTLGRLLNSAIVCWQGNPIAVRASLGWAAYGPGDDDRDLLARADATMYRSKRGRMATTAQRRIA